MERLVYDFTEITFASLIEALNREIDRLFPSTLPPIPTPAQQEASMRYWELFEFRQEILNLLQKMLDE